MEQVIIDLEFDELLHVGVSSDPSFIGAVVSTKHPEKATFGFTIPTHRLPNYIARLTTGAARTAQLEAQLAGKTFDEVVLAEQRQAFQAVGTGARSRSDKDDAVVVYFFDEKMAVLPVELPRAAAQQLFSELASLLAS